MSPVSLCLLGAVSVLLLAPTRALAQDPGTSTDADARAEEARSLFAEGVALASEERFDEAADTFRRAYLLRPAVPIAFNLGNALVESGRLVEGAEVLRQVVRDPEASDDLRHRAEAAIAGAEPRIGRIVVHVVGPPEGVTVEVGGLALPPGFYGVPRSADPGLVDVVASRGSETLASATVDVPEGGEAEMTVEVPEPVAEVALLPTEGPVTTDSADGGLLTKWWFWTAVGAVVVGAVLTAVLVSTSGTNTEGSLGSGMLQ